MPSDEDLRAAITDEWGVWSPGEVARRAGSKGHSPTLAVKRWAAAGKIFPVPVAGSDHFPGFCFDPTSRPRPVIAPALRALGPGWTGWGLARWWVTPHDGLGGGRPVDSDDDQAVVAAARATAAGLTG